jgi:hypothetical protein
MFDRARQLPLGFAKLPFSKQERWGIDYYSGIVVSLTEGQLIGKLETSFEVIPILLLSPAPGLAFALHLNLAFLLLIDGTYSLLQNCLKLSPYRWGDGSSRAAAWSTRTERTASRGH